MSHLDLFAAAQRLLPAVTAANHAGQSTETLFGLVADEHRFHLREADWFVLLITLEALAWHNQWHANPQAAPREPT